MSTPGLSTGLHWVDAPCPRCGAIVELPVFLTTVLTTPQEDPPTLRVKAKCGSGTHDCRQARIELDMGLLDRGRG